MSEVSPLLAMHVNGSLRFNYMHKNYNKLCQSESGGQIMLNTGIYLNAQYAYKLYVYIHMSMYISVKMV